MSRCLFVACLVVATPVALVAQRVNVLGEDAAIPGRGVFRVEITPSWTNYDEAYDAGGTVRPLGARLSSDALGGAQLGGAAQTEQELRSISGLPTFTLSLGAVNVSSTVRVRTTPIKAEMGIMSRVSVSVLVPIVRTQTDVVVSPNPPGSTPNVGLNPALSLSAARDQNVALVAQLRAAADQLESSVGGSAFCAANPSDSSCQLVADARGFAGGVERVYGDDANVPVYVPLAGTDIQNALEARVASLKSAFGSFGTGITVAGPFAAQAPLGLDAFQSLLVSPPFSADSLKTTTRYAAGDVELGAKLVLIDPIGSRRGPLTGGFHLRSAVAGILRLGTAKTPSPGSVTDPGSGDGQTDLELRSFNDLFFGRHFVTTVVFRAGRQLADRVRARIPDTPDQVFRESFRLQEVDRDLGDYVELEGDPRFAVGEHFTLWGHYLYRRKQADSYRGSYTIPPEETGGTELTLDASVLGANTAQHEQRIGGGVTYSTRGLGAAAAGRFPLEISLLHYETITGSSNVPKLSTDLIQLRLYYRLFGR